MGPESEGIRDHERWRTAHAGLGPNTSCEEKKRKEEEVYTERRLFIVKKRGEYLEY